MAIASGTSTTSMTEDDNDDINGHHHHHRHQCDSKQIIDEWTESGIQQYVDLPVIVLLGDTSSGKSSVLSSLIGVDLPSGSSLTTKTPILIQVKNNTKSEQKSKVEGDEEYEDSDEQQQQRHGTVATAVVDIHWRYAERSKSSSSTPIIGQRQPNSPRHRKREIEQQHLDGRELSALPSSVSASSSTSTENFVYETKAHDVRGQHDSASVDPAEEVKVSQSATPPVWKPYRITALEKIPTVIRKAQELILNYRQTHIAPDVIALTIYSSSLSTTSSAGNMARRELTLVDLPGLVQYQHTSDISLLSQVEQVVLEYVENPRSILVPIIAAPTNIHNSKVLQWCRTFDPSTTRTIPVLTKPDLIDKGSEDDVLNLLLMMDERQKEHVDETVPPPAARDPTEGRHSSFRFRHGFFMVKNRGQASLDNGLTIEDGLLEEKEYFAMTHPWNNPSLLEMAAMPRLGISALQNTLAATLRQLFHDSLPDIISEIDDHLKAAEVTLEAWGEVHEKKIDQRRYYQQLVSKIVSTLESSLSGKSRVSRRRRHGKPSVSSKIFDDSGGTDSIEPGMGGAARLHAACSVFMKEIQRGSLATVSTLVEGCPVIVSGTLDDVKGELVYLDEENGFCCVDYVDEKDHTTAELFDGIGYKAGDHTMENHEVWSDGSRIFISRGPLFDSLRKISVQKVRTDPSWLEKSIARTRTENMAVFVNADMFHSIVAEFVEEDWTPACHDLVQTLDSILTDSLDVALQEGFGSWNRYPLLLEMVKKQSQHALSKLVENARLEVESHLDTESHPYTQDETLMERMKNLKLSQIKRDLEVQLRLDQEGVVFDSGALSTIVDRVFARASRRNFLAEEMEMLLNCYGKVATQRVVDRTPQICWSASRRAAAAIEAELAYVTDDVLETLFWESPEQKVQYQRLQQKVNDLRKALNTVRSMK